MPAFASKDLTDALRSIGSKAPRVRFARAPSGTRTAIFGVHGISPIQRYAFQDQVAAAFEGYLNAQEPRDSTLSWKSVVYWPECVNDGPIDVEGVRPSALRVYRSDDDPQNPSGRIYDVYEGYWSPLSKEKTNISSALRWLLNATFLGTSSTARLPCTLQKLLFDVSYVLVLLAGGVSLCAAVVGFGWLAWWLLAAKLAGAGGLNITYLDLLGDPFHAVLRLPPVVYAEFVVDLILGYIAAQLVVIHNARRKRLRDTAAVHNDTRTGGHFRDEVARTRWFHRVVLGILWVLFALFAFAAWRIPVWFGYGGVLGDSRLWFLLFVLAILLGVASLQAARSIADFAVENVLGDVQVYTTHDQNSTFYGIRQLIIASVAAALKGVLSVAAAPAAIDESLGEPPQPYYQRIHVLGHSLGSTIAMDVLILLRQLIQEKTLPDRQWESIRSFTTFGTALEKTRFFFDVRQPTLNAAQDQWENDIYGRYFTSDGTTLRNPANAAGIYWSNYWYRHDVVANAIESYQSDVDVGAGFVFGKTPRPICLNIEIAHPRPPLAWVHSDYLADAQFWAHVGPILTS